MEKKLQELKARLQEVDDLNSAVSLLSWDQATYMPSGGAAARGRQMAMLSRMAHEKFTDARTGALLDALQPYGESLPYESDEASLIRVARRSYEKQVKIPSQLLAEFRAHSAAAYQVWTSARPENDLGAVTAISLRR